VTIEEENVPSFQGGLPDSIDVDCRSNNSLFTYESPKAESPQNDKIEIQTKELEAFTTFS